MKNYNKHLIVNAAMASLLLCGCSSLNSRISGLGYTPVQPPTTLTPPGAVAKIVSHSPLQLKLVCPLNMLPGPAAPVQTSKTRTEEANRRLSGSFDVSADFVKRVKASINATDVRSISLQLTNLEVIDLSLLDAQVLARQADPQCLSMIHSLFNLNWPVTMVDQVLKGDVIYEVSYDSNVSANAEANITAQIAGKLGVGLTATGDRRIQGTGLIWGIQENKCNLLGVQPSLQGECTRKPTLWERMFGLTETAVAQETQAPPVVPVLLGDETVQVVQTGD